MADEQYLYRFYLKDLTYRPAFLPLVIVPFVWTAAIVLRYPESATEGLLIVAGIGAIAVPLILFWPITERSTWFLEITGDGGRLRSVPSRIAKLWGEQGTEVPLRPGGEILVRLRISYGAWDGNSVSIRSPSSEEQCVWRGCAHVDPTRWNEFAKQVTAGTGLPVRLLIERVEVDGVREEEWIPQSLRREVLLGCAVTLLPLGGGVIRLITSSYYWLGVFGLVFSVIYCLSYFSLKKRAEQLARLTHGSKIPTPFLVLRSLILFVVVYFGNAYLVEMLATTR